MKKILYLILALTLVAVSCKNRKKDKQVKEAKAIEKTETSNEGDPNEIAPLEVALENEDKAEGIAVISLSKSPCFGVCPAYSVEFYSNGSVMYTGTSNVDKIGRYKGFIGTKKIKDFLKEASNMGYFMLKDKYDNENVTDVPTAITYMNYSGKKKKVICRFDCSDVVIKVNEKIEALIKQVEFKRIE